MCYVFSLPNNCQRQIWRHHWMYALVSKSAHLQHSWQWAEGSNSPRWSRIVSRNHSNDENRIGTEFIMLKVSPDSFSLFLTATILCYMLPNKINAIILYFFHIKTVLLYLIGVGTKYCTKLHTTNIKEICKCLVYYPLFINNNTKMCSRIIRKRRKFSIFMVHFKL